MGGGKSRGPSGPDGEDLIAITERNIAANRELFREYMSFARETFESQTARADDFHAITSEQMQNQSDFADYQRNRYIEQAVPLEEQYIDRVMSYDSPERREAAAAAAAADVAASQRAALDTYKTRMESFGIDPSMTRGGALDRAMTATTALETAGAATQARENSELRGIALAGEGTNVGKGLPSSSADALRVGGGLAAQGLDATGRAGQLGISAYGQGAQMIGQANDMATAGYSVANDIYRSDLMGYSIAMENSPVNIAAGVVGTALGAGWNPVSAQDGGIIEPHHSPSGGAVPDDVPLMASAGEAVLPEKVVRYHGIKHLQKLADEAEKALPTE